MLCGISLTQSQYIECLMEDACCTVHPHSSAPKLLKSSETFDIKSQNYELTNPINIYTFYLKDI
jgi:hypothetical protein